MICWVSPTVAARVTCAFRLGFHTFPEKITTGIVFYIGHGLLPVLVCDNAISHRPYAHVVALQIVCDLLCITDGFTTIDVCFPMWIAHTHLVEPCAEQLPG